MSVIHDMGRHCGVWSDTLVAFSLGDLPELHGVEIPEENIDEHIAQCDECQAFLSELWAGSLDTDLSEPVVRILELEKFLVDTAKLGGGMLADLMRAISTYGMAAIDETGTTVPVEDDESE